MSLLQEALNNCGKELGEVSRKSGIPAARLTEILNGADPSLSEVRLLGSVLKLSLADFAPPSAETSKASILFRSAAQRKNVPQNVFAETLSRKMAYSLEMLKPAGPEPWWARHFEDVKETESEATAFKVRELFCQGDQVGPLLSLPQLLVERLQIMLFVVNASQFEGASAYLGGIPFVFVAARYPARMLFTCAHELGHILAHHDPKTDFAEIDGPDDVESRKSSSQRERFAHAFASALLLPRAGVGIVLKKIREMKSIPMDSPIGDVELLFLARIFGVSFAAAARRCEDLALLPRGGAASLDEKLKSDFESAEKRAETLGLPPRATITFPPLPNALLHSAVERIRAGELSIGKASMMLGLSIGDLLAANAPLYQ